MGAKASGHATPAVRARTGAEQSTGTPRPMTTMWPWQVSWLAGQGNRSVFPMRMASVTLVDRSLAAHSCGGSSGLGVRPSGFPLGSIPRDGEPRRLDHRRPGQTVNNDINMSLYLRPKLMSPIGGRGVDPLHAKKAPSATGFPASARRPLCKPQQPDGCRKESFSPMSGPPVDIASAPVTRLRRPVPTYLRPCRARSCRVRGWLPPPGARPGPACGASGWSAPP